QVHAPGALGLGRLVLGLLDALLHLDLLLAQPVEVGLRGAAIGVGLRGRELLLGGVELRVLLLHVARQLVDAVLGFRGDGLGLEHRLLLSLHAAVLDLAELAEREQHRILTLLRLCHATILRRAGRIPLLRSLSRWISWGNAHNCARRLTAIHTPPPWASSTCIATSFPAWTTAPPMSRPRSPCSMAWVRWASPSSA